MDFGLMALARGAIGREVLSIGGRMGTYSYVVPEQIQGQIPDARADLYSIGCMLYESVTGAPPFGREHADADVLRGHLSVPPDPPSRVVDGVPPALDDLILRLLAKRPQDRLGHADDLAAALLDFADPSLSDSGIRGDRHRPAQLYRPQLRGRQQALDDLLGHLDGVQQNRGGMVLVGGESGIGKTFLVSEFGRRANHRGISVVTGDCLPSTGGDSSVTDTGGVPLLPFRPLILLAIGAPFSLAIMYGFGLNHAPIYDGILAPDSRFLRYSIYFFFGMLLAERSPPRSALWLTLLLGSLGLAWWAGLYASGQQLAYVPARLLMCLGLIALLPVLLTLPLHAPPVNAIGRESLFFYLWHPLMMGTVILTGIGPLATLALSILLLGIASRLAARNPATALLLGVNPARQQFS